MNRRSRWSPKWFGPVWVSFGIVALLAAGIFGPPLAIGASYKPGPSQPLSELGSYVVGFSGSAALGVIFGLLAWVLASGYLPTTRLKSLLLTSAAFAAACALTALAIFLFEVSLFTGVPTCLASPILLALATALTVAMPWIFHWFVAPKS
jgi:hypothetical protein